MITVYSFVGAWGISSVSPFCSKLETWLKMAEIPHQVDRNFNPLKAPKGKAPYIEIDGDYIADSSIIIDELTERYEVGLDADLSAEQRGQATLIQRTCENHLYFALVYSRWLVDAYWPTVRDTYFRGLAGPARYVVSGLARRKVKKLLHHEGTSRHDHATILASAKTDVDALADVLGDDPFFLGQKPTSIDATAFAFIDGLYQAEVARDFAALVEAHDNLIAYSERMRFRYWPEI